jgi:hypothetical protein
MNLNIIAVWFAVGVILSTQGCKNNNDIKSLSPRQVVSLYIKAHNECNRELLRKIIYFPSGMSEAEIEKKLGPASISREAKGGERITRAAGLRVTPGYEKILNEDTAEVGVLMKIGFGPLSKDIPGDQYILKRENEVWKIHYARSELTKEQLATTIKENPQAAWVYYRLGMEIQSDNPYKACMYFNKYYELEPTGFYVDSELKNKINILKNPDYEEQELLKSLNERPENAGGRIIIYIRLSQLFVETGDFNKAQKYLNDCESLINKKKQLNPYLVESFKKARESIAGK